MIEESAIEPFAIKLRKTDIDIDRIAVVWSPD